MKEFYHVCYRRIFLTACIFLASIMIGHISAQSPVNVEPAKWPCDAPIQCGFNPIDGYFLEMTRVTGYYPWPIRGNCLCDDPNWFAFIAGADQVIITLEVEYCSRGRGSIQGLQFVAFEGNPDCSNNMVNGLNPIVGQCTSYLTEGTYNFTLYTTPGYIYYLIFDGKQASLCGVGITIEQGGQPPQIDEVVYPNEIRIPEFQGGDTICIGANDIEVCSDDLPQGASFTLWILPNGDTVRSDIGSSCVTLDSIFAMPGPFDLCVAAGNDCDTTAYNCKTYYVAPVAPDKMMEEICEGEEYNWQYEDINSENLTPGMHRFSAFASSTTQGCMQKHILNLLVKGENDENPTQIDTIICYGDSYFYDVNPSTSESFVTAQPAENVEYTDVSPISGCDTFFEIKVDMVGGVFEIVSQCDSSGNLVFDYKFIKPYPEILDLDDPGLRITYEWYDLTDDEIISEEEKLILSEEELKRMAYIELVLKVGISYGNDFKEYCEFTSPVYTLNPEQWLPEILSVEGPRILSPGLSGNYTIALSSSGNGEIIDTVLYLPEGVTSSNTSEGIRLTAGDNAQTGQVCFEVIDQCGFKDSLCFTLKIDTTTSTFNPEISRNDNVYIPNAFSPNSDGINDVFTIGASAKVKAIKDVVISDHWGNRVFYKKVAEIKGELSLWNGKYMGNIMNSGVYVYGMDVIYINGKVRHLQGYLTLLR